MSEVFGSADHTPRYVHQASENGMRAALQLRAGAPVEKVVALVVRAASFGNLALNAEAVA